MLHLQVQYSQQKCGLHGYCGHPTIRESALGKSMLHIHVLDTRPRTNGFEFDQK